MLKKHRTFLLAQWSGVRLPVGGGGWGGTGSIPDEGRSHLPRSNEAPAPQLLSPFPATEDGWAPEFLLHKRSHCSEKPEHPAPPNRKPTCSNKDPAQPKINR